MTTPPQRSIFFAPSQVALKTVFTICFGVLCVVTLVAFALKTSVSITFTVAALMLAVALDHLVQMLERRGVKRGIAIALVMFGCLVAAVGLGLLLIPPVVSQVQHLIEEWPRIWARFQKSDVWIWAEAHFHVQRAVKQASQNAGGLVSSAASPVLVAVSTLVSAIAAVVTITFLTLLMLIFGRDLVRGSMREVNPGRRARYHRVTTNIYRSIGGYLGGIVVICTINAICATTFLGLTHEPYFVVLGVMSGCSSMIPYVGPFVAGASISSVAWAVGGVSKALLTAGYFIVYGQIEGNVIAPIVFRRTAHVNPLITLLAIMFLAELAGIFGAIIAVPVAAAAQIIVREVFLVRREQQAQLLLDPNAPLEAEHGGEQPPGPH